MKDDSKWWEKTNICAPGDSLDIGSLNLTKEATKRIEELEKEVEELKAQLARAKEDHQYDNLVHQKELESLQSPVKKLREKGLM
ncbi:uncharacterized protein METZ01_LOCUS126561 [marine metagenome]|uniref:Uncharacterized protein n=1 Tax=marine metagenome TaxID=408172 RepID=A0A381YB98_9ZZZZ